MKLTFQQIHGAIEALKSLSEEKLPFRLGMLFSKNLSVLEKEEQFYIEQERKFAATYLEIDPKTGEFLQTEPGIFHIKEGKQAECAEARRDLDNFTCEVAIRLIPESDLEKINFTINQLNNLQFIIAEENKTEEE